MTVQKARALGVAAVGLIGFLFALASGFTLLYAPAEKVDDGLLTSFFLIGLVFGAVFITIGMVHYDRLCQRELQDKEFKRRHFRKGVAA